MYVPQGKSFLLNPINFYGPCNSNGVIIQAIKLLKCNKTSVRDVEFVDSPQVHLVAFGCNGVGANNVSIRSPGDIPNTDGIHLQST
ncbi:hypothetical protein Scep_008412 [Stephania cephalantha]|uniref:Uncharacterized protein n=1 Tax=Stephania cephalantha TaxID=152367 RepID=A0AAP0KED1_9MAGN